MIPTAGAWPLSACAKVAMMMIISSTPSRIMLSIIVDDGGKVLTHPFATKVVSQIPEKQLTEESTTRCSDLDAEVLVGVQSPL